MGHQLAPSMEKASSCYGMYRKKDAAAGQHAEWHVGYLAAVYNENNGDKLC